MTSFTPLVYTTKWIYSENEYEWIYSEMFFLKDDQSWQQYDLIKYVIFQVILSEYIHAIA